MAIAGWRSSGSRPTPSTAGRAEPVERVGVEQHQPGEEGAEPHEHGGRPGHELAVLRCGSRTARPTRRSRAPRPTAAASPPGSTTSRCSGRRPGVVVEEWSATTASERSVRAKAASMIDHADGQQRGERVDRPPRRVDEPAVAPGAPRAPRRRRRSATTKASDQAGGAEALTDWHHYLVITTCSGSCWAWSLNFDGHLVIRLSRCADERVPSSTVPVTMTSRPSANGSGTSPRVADRDRRLGVVAVGHPEVQLASRGDGSSPGRPRRSLVGAAGLTRSGAREGCFASARGAERRVDERRARAAPRRRGRRPGGSSACDRDPSRQRNAIMAQWRKHQSC